MEVEVGGVEEDGFEREFVEGFVGLVVGVGLVGGDGEMGVIVGEEGVED